MALKLLNEDIAPSSNLSLLGQSIVSLKLNGEVVWQKYNGTPSPVLVTEDTILVAGTDFPANVDVTVCMCGGGGGGSCSIANVNLVGGGFQGQILANQTVNVPDGEAVAVTIGVGGGSVNGGDYNGLDGTETTFGNYLTANGGLGGVTNDIIGYDGLGAEFVSPCDNIAYNDGTSTGSANRGGQAGAFGDGGNGAHYDPAGAGGIGAGGGGVSRSNGGGEPSGNGGRGQLIVSW